MGIHAVSFEPRLVGPGGLERQVDGKQGQALACDVLAQNRQGNAAEGVCIRVLDLGDPT